MDFTEFELGYLVTYRTLKLTTLLGEWIHVPPGSRAGDYFWIPHGAGLGHDIPARWGAPKRFSFASEALVSDVESDTGDYDESGSDGPSEVDGELRASYSFDGNPYEDRWETYPRDGELQEEDHSEDWNEEPVLPKKRTREMQESTDQGWTYGPDEGMELCQERGHRMPARWERTFSESDEESAQQDSPGDSSEQLSSGWNGIPIQRTIDRLLDENSPANLRPDEASEQEEEA